MKQTTCDVSEADLSLTVMPQLDGRVFHVTCWAHAQQILRDAAIGSNIDGRHSGAFGTLRPGVHRLAGRVSFFDFRALSEEDRKWCLMKCHPLMGARDCANHLAIFFLAGREYPKLVRVSASDSLELEQTHVPECEVGVPGPVALSQIEELLELRIAARPTKDDLIRAFEAKHDIDLSVIDPKTLKG